MYSKYLCNNFEANVYAPFLQLFLFRAHREAWLSKSRIRSCKKSDVIVVVVTIIVIASWRLAYMVDNIKFTPT